MNRKIAAWGTAILLFLIGWGIILSYLTPQTIVNTLGTNNTYAILFIIGLIGGISTFTSATFYTALITFAVGGANPLLLGITGGVAATIGDSLFYVLGKRGARTTTQKTRLHKRLKKFTDWIKQQPKTIVPLFVLLWTAIPFLPNDLLTLTLGATKQKYRKIIFFVFTGNIIALTLVATIAYRGAYG